MWRSFFAFVWASLFAILIITPSMYADVLRVLGGPVTSAFAFFIAISTFLLFLGTGVVRRWHWTFWLILLAFRAGVLRVPASILELNGVIGPTGPT